MKKELNRTFSYDGGIGRYTPHKTKRRTTATLKTKSNRKLNGMEV